MNEQIKQKFFSLAKEVLQIEARAIVNLADRLDQTFVDACQLIEQGTGHVVVMGIGKSGHIGRKIAATLASTGTPAFFVHPAEAAHGDLGMITQEDIVLALSNSGESDEVLAVLPSLKRKGVSIVALTGNPQSTLGQAATVHIDVAVDKEACPLNLAPTASTTVALALGDALAVTLLEWRGFQPEDFALSHPGGALGRRLLIHVKDVMQSGAALPMVKSCTLVRDALLEISRKRLGMTAVLDNEQHLVGLFTDGDLRRALDAGLDIRTAEVDSVMTINPHCIQEDRLAVEAVQMMEKLRINGLLVTNKEGRLVGALNMHDLLRAKIV